MYKEERLNFCKICKHRSFDLKQGVVCGLTDQTPDFEEECSFFIEEPGLRAKVEAKQLSASIALNKASTGKRFANFIIDVAFYVILSYIVGIIIGVIWVFTSPSTLYELENIHPLWERLFGLIIIVIYYTTFEALTGRTLGKYITKTIVVTEDGRKPDFNTILKRSLSRCIPFEPLSFLGSEAKGWHDKITKTTVINYKQDVVEEY